MWLYGRYAIWRMASMYEGLWTAYEICGGEYQLMDGALLTVISKRPIWSKEPNMLDVHAQDKGRTGARDHEGYILIDRTFPRRARRIVEYAGAERSEQNLEISADGKVIHVNPTELQYKKHILRRSGLLGLN
jgi:hypothetical protein